MLILPQRGYVYGFFFTTGALKYCKISQYKQDWNLDLGTRIK